MYGNAMLRALGRIEEIDRAECRRRVAQNFSVERVVPAYEHCYEQLLDAAPRPRR
jgi:hypothetical protein